MRLDSRRASFLMFAGAIQVGVEKRAAHSLAQRHAEDVTTPGDLVPQARIDVAKMRFEDVSPELMEFLLLSRHERDHFETFLSSPLGLLVYRSYLVLNVTLNWLFAKFFIPGGLAHEPRGRPFADWLRDDAMAWIERAAARGAIALPADDTDDLPDATKLAMRLEYVRHVALPEIVVLSEFLDALMERPEGMTLGRFAELANRAFTHLAMRCDVPLTCRWTTQNPDQPLHPDWDGLLSTTELFELAALGTEAATFHACNAPPDVIAHWFAGYGGYPYERGLQLAAKTGMPLDMLGSLARLAVRSPCDLAVCVDGELPVEVMHPSWRFRDFHLQLFDHRSFAGETRQQRVERFTGALEDGGLPAVELVLCACGALAPKPTIDDIDPGKLGAPCFGPGSEFFPGADDAYVLHLGHAVADMAEAFREGIAGRDDPAALLAIRERLVYYEDEAAFPDIASEEDLMVAFTTHVSCLSGYMHLVNLFEGLDAGMVPAWDEACIARLRRMLDDPDEQLEQFQASLRVGTVAVEMFGEPYARAMGFVGSGR